MIPSYLGPTSMNALNGSFIALTIITTALRFGARRWQKTPLLVADWLMLPALVNFLGCAAVLIYSVHIKVYGYSSSEIDPKNFYKSSQVAVVLDVLTVMCLGCVKSSACMFYRSIFCVGHRKNVLNVVILITVGLIAAWTVTYSLMSGLACGTHLQDYLHDPSVEEKYCITFDFNYSLAITDLIFDIWVLILPVPSVLRLKTTPLKKATIMGVFLLACGGLAAAITRAVIFAQIYFGGPEGLLYSGDNGAKSTKIEFFMILEAGLAIVAVNMPSIGMLVAKHGPEKILRSVRSAISLASNRSRSSRRSQDHDDSVRYASSDAKGPHSSGSLSYPVPFTERDGETICMADLPGRDVESAPAGQVRVDTSCSQVSSRQSEYQK